MKLNFFLLLIFFLSHVCVNAQPCIKWYNRGVKQAGEGEYGSSIRSFTKAIELDGDFYQAWFNRGLAYSKLGQYEAAVADYSKAIQFNLTFAPAYVNRGADK